VFVQGDRGIDRSQGGLGLGLAIVRGIVTAHHGRSWAESEGATRGSEFFVALPAAGTSGVPSPCSDHPPLPPSMRCSRILIVDDNEDAAALLREHLSGLGHQVEVALDGRDALAAAATFDPHAAFLDIGLPGMDGLELARRLRALPGLRTVKLVAITGYGRPADLARSREAGFDHHLVKPVESGRLERLLEGLFGAETTS
jgi:CheY-like chemotaxis protein